MARLSKPLGHDSDRGAGSVLLRSVLRTDRRGRSSSDGGRARDCQTTAQLHQTEREVRNARDHYDDGNHPSSAKCMEGVGGFPGTSEDAWTTSLESVRDALDADASHDRLVLLRATSQELFAAPTL